MRQGVAYGTRLRIGVAQFIRDFPRHLVSEMTAGLRSRLCAGESCGMEREHSRAGVAVVRAGPISLLNACAIGLDLGWALRTEVSLCCLIAH